MVCKWINGKAVWGCWHCLGRAAFERVYTARKFWTGDEVYGREKNLEMNHEWGESLLRNAETKHQRRHRR